MRLRRTHSCRGEKFAAMTDDDLLRVMRRTYRFAADTPADQRAAQAELRRRKAARTDAARCA